MTPLKLFHYLDTFNKKKFKSMTYIDASVTLDEEKRAVQSKKTL